MLNGLDVLAVVLLVLCVLIVGAMWGETKLRRGKLDSNWPR